MIKEHLPNGATRLRGRLVDGHTSALTHRSIPLSPTGGYVSVTGITGVCDEKKVGPPIFNGSVFCRVVGAPQGGRRIQNRVRKDTATDRTRLRMVPDGNSVQQRDPVLSVRFADPAAS